MKIEVILSSFEDFWFSIYGNDGEYDKRNIKGGLTETFMVKKW